jgi:hypothetical protein
VKAAIFSSSDTKLANSIWESEVFRVYSEGQQSVEALLNAPMSETFLDFTAYVLLLNKTWTYFSDAEKGPGLERFSVKVSEYATLTIDLGLAGVRVGVDGREVQTNSSGMVGQDLSILMSHTIDLPEMIELDDRTRAVFSEWNDGDTSLTRSVTMDGDFVIKATYRKQYFLQVSSTIGAAGGSGWYDEGDVAHFSAAESVGMDGLVGWLGGQHIFLTWTGDFSGRAPTAGIVMNAPYEVQAVYEEDYGLALIYLASIIAAAGGAIVGSFFIIRARNPMMSPDQPGSNVQDEFPNPSATICPHCGAGLSVESKFCDKCGQPVNS